MNAVLYKRLKFQAKHRGTKELDLLMSEFIDKYLDTLPEEDLKTFDLFLEEPESDLTDWVINQKEAPEKYQDIQKLFFELH